MLAVLLTAALTGPGGDLAPCNPVHDPGCTDGMTVRVVPCPVGGAGLPHAGGGAVQPEA